MSGTASLPMPPTPPAQPPQGAAPPPGQPGPNHIPAANPNDPHGVAESRARTTSLLDAARRIEAMKDPAAPHLEALPTPPTIAPHAALAALGTWGPLLAIFGAFATREPMTAALNAAAAGMRAYHQGNLQAVHQARVSYQQNLQRALAHNNELNQQYGDALRGAGLDLTKARTSIQAIAAAHHDQLMQEEINQRGAESAARLLLMRQTAAIKLTELQANQKYREAQMKAAQEKSDAAMIAADTKAGIPIPKSLGGTGVPPKGKGLPLTADAVDYAASMYMLTGQMPALGLGTSGNVQQIREAIINRAAVLAKQWGGTGTVLARRAQMKALNAGLDTLQRQKANVGSYEGTAQRVADQVLSLAPKAVGGSDILPINQWIQAGMKATGSGNVAAFTSALTSFVNEYARIMSSPGAAGGVTSDAARSEAASLLSANMTLPQLQAVIAQMKRAMATRPTAIDQQIGVTTQAIQKLLQMPPVSPAAPAAPTPLSQIGAAPKRMTYDPATGTIH